MSGGRTETPVGCEAAPGGSGGKKRDSLGTASSAHLIIKGTEYGAVVLGGPHRIPASQMVPSDPGRPPLLAGARLRRRSTAPRVVPPTSRARRCQLQ